MSKAYRLAIAAFAILAATCVPDAAAQEAIGGWKSGSRQGTPTQACKECGASGECAAAKVAKVAKVLKGEDWQGGEGLKYSANAEYNGQDIGTAYAGVLHPTDNGFAFTFVNKEGDYDSYAKYRPKKDQLCLWHVESNGKSRWYYLSHYETCQGKWTDGKASLKDTKITVYTY